MSMIRLKEYAARHGRSMSSVFSKVKRGAYPSARKIGAYWYMDEDEPWEGIKPKLRKRLPEKQHAECEMGSKIVISEYCRRNGLKYNTAWNLCKEGKLKSAEKIDGHWLVDANEPYSARIEFENENHGMIGIKEYCARHHLNRIMVTRKCNNGDLKSAIKIGNRWFIDENEPYYDKRTNTYKIKYSIPKRAKNTPPGMIGIRDYCKRYHVSYDSVYKRIRKGELRSAVKIEGQWFIDENEPTFDKRIKNGKYIGRRKEKAIEKGGT